MKTSLVRFAGNVLPLIVAALLPAGCNGGGDKAVGTKGAPPHELTAVPKPIDLLLPQKIRIHPFTGTRTFDQAGGVRGIDVRIEAKDAFGDSTKAFGDYFFELYAYHARGPDTRGKLIASWNEPLMDPKKNLMHWDSIAKRYQFKLEWDQPIPVGRKFVLAATFSSPFTERLFDQHTFISGQ